MTKRKAAIVFAVLFLCGIGLYKGYEQRGSILNEELVLNEDMFKESLTKLLNEINTLHNRLPIGEPITINMNSGGGSLVDSAVLYSRIIELQAQGRPFKGTIYGICASACGSLFALMDYRYMTQNAIYMQHFGSSTQRNPAPSIITIGRILDSQRLTYDATMFKLELQQLYNILNRQDMIGVAFVMNQNGFIHGIVQQPKIDQI